MGAFQETLAPHWKAQGPNAPPEETTPLAKAPGSLLASGHWQLATSQ